MIWNPVANFVACIKSRPPLVIFTLCLFSFLITTVSLAYYVQHNEKLQNTDAQEQWLSLIRYMDKTGFCIQDNSMDTKMNYSSDNKVKISTSALVTLPVTNKTFVHGVVSLRNWYHPCLNSDLKPENIDIFFNILPVKDNNDRDNVCIVVSGPKQFMPKVKNPSACTIQEEKEFSKKMTILNDASSCPDNSFVKFEFDRSSINKVESEEYLSMSDKSVINMHLIATSYFIIFVILVIICYALIKGNKNEQNQDGRQLLSGKVVHT